MSEVLLPVSALQAELVRVFMQRIIDDARINTSHISLYVSLVYYWKENDIERPVSVYSHEVMPLCKISGSATYHRCIRELNDYGYIRYVPSFNHFLGSLVYFVMIERNMERENMKKITAGSVAQHELRFDQQRDLSKERIRYFLIPDGIDYKIMRVRLSDQESFRKKYVASILIEADSIAELLIRFSEKAEEVAVAK